MCGRGCEVGASSIMGSSRSGLERTGARPLLGPGLGGALSSVDATLASARGRELQAALLTSFLDWASRFLTSPCWPLLRASRERL